MGWAERLNPNSWYNRSRKQKEREAKEMAAFGSAIKRFSRIGLALLITGILATVKKDPKWLVFAPVINAVAKYLRDRFGIKYLPL